jgi:uncharacterized protein YidB (DUF937 family)
MKLGKPFRVLIISSLPRGDMCGTGGLVGRGEGDLKKDFTPPLDKGVGSLIDSFQNAGKRHKVS